MSRLSQLFTISINTFIQLSRGRIFLNTGFLSIGLILLCFIATKFTYGVAYRVALDIGLGLLTLSSVIIAISLGVGLIANEIESRTLYVVLSRSVPRYIFLLGKFFGLIGIMAVNILILGTSTIATYYFLGGKIDSLILWAIFYILLEAELLLLITLFLSLISNKVITIMMTLTLWFLGHAVYDIVDSPFVESIPWLKTLLGYYAYIFPAFYKINLKDFVLYQQTLPLPYLLSGAFYAVLYSTAVIIFSCIAFNKKNLE